MECFYGSSSLILQFAICCKNITMLFLLLVNIMNTPDFLIEWRIFHMKHIRNFFPLHGLPWCGSSDGLMCIFTLWPNSMKDFWQESHLKFFCPSWIVFFLWMVMAMVIGLSCILGFLCIFFVDAFLQSCSECFWTKITHIWSEIDLLVDNF